MKKNGTQKPAKSASRPDFWASLPRPFVVMAPLANVTDSVFRRIIAKHSRMGEKDPKGRAVGGPDAMWTEFVSADGLASPGRPRLLPDLAFSEGERPIVAQLFTGHPEAMRTAAALVAKLGFDGLDINMGCPDRAVEKQGGGAGMIKDPKATLAVIRAAREGAPGLPVSVKTRIGYNKLDLEWIRTLLAEKLPALTIHLRTRKEMSDVPAHWELMPEIVKMRDEIQADLPREKRTLIIGNGDVLSLEDAYDKAERYGCDGIMIGRGIFGTPWLFDKKLLSSKTAGQKTPQERLEIMLDHTKLFEKTFGKKNAKDKKPLKNFAVMKKHFKAYVSGWDGAKELRVKLMETNDFKEVKGVVERYLQVSRL